MEKRSDIEGLVRHPSDEGLFGTIAHIEFQLRCLGLVVAKAADDAYRPALPGSLGTWSRYIHESARFLACTECEDLAVLTADSPQLEVVPGQSIYSLRNQVFHGGPKPAVDAELLRLVVEKNASRIIAIWEHGHAEGVSPFFLDLEGELLVLHDFDRICATYWSRRDAAIEIIDESILVELFREKRRLRIQEPNHAEFMRELEQDLRAFCDRKRVRVYLDDDDGAFLIADWTERTPSGTTRRMDRFCVLTSGERMWVPAEGRRPYAEFIAGLVHWDVLRSRLLESVEGQLLGQSRLHKELFGRAADDTRSIDPPARWTSPVGDVSGDSALSEVFDRIIADTEVLQGSTMLIAMTGEAGAGKTHSLLHLANRSLSEVRSSAAPVVIYTSSSGRSANSIGAIINDALSNTLVLNFERVLALCRVGLAVLVVDGFDELIGFRSYDDPLSGLSSLFEGLRGRGTVVLSSRSSYADLRLLPALRAPSTSPWFPRAGILELRPWTRKERQELIGHEYREKEQSVLDPKQLDALLSTPFFCLAYLGWLTSKDPDLLSFVTTNYLQRELSKMHSSRGGKLFEAGSSEGLGDVVDRNDAIREHLVEIFGEVAELILREGQSEVSEEDLILAAESVLGRSLAAEERRRITVICGVSAEWQESERVFTFTHPVLAEYFLARRILDLPPEKRTDLLLEVDISPLCVRLILTSSDLGTVHAAYDDLQRAWMSGRHLSTEPSSSLGSLWSTLFAAAGEPLRLIGGRVEELVVSTPGEVYFRGCALGRLRINQDSKVVFERSVVDFLDISRGQNVKVELRDESSVKELLTRKGLFTHRLAIRRELGLEEEVNLDHEQEVIDFYRKMLAKCGGTVVVQSEDLSMEREDGQPGWVTRYTLKRWQSFVRAMEQQNRVVQRGLSARGKAKVRLKFDLS